MAATACDAENNRDNSEWINPIGAKARIFLDN